MNSGHSPLRLPVRTESGQALGSVVDITIDLEQQIVMYYHVKPSRLVPDIVSSPLLIHRHQVIRIDVNEIIVDDAVVRQQKPSRAPQPQV